MKSTFHMLLLTTFPWEAMIESACVQRSRLQPYRTLMVWFCDHLTMISQHDCSEFGLLVSLVEFEPLSYWSAHDCDWVEYKGCTKNRKARAKDQWGHARSFGQISLGSIM